MFRFIIITLLILTPSKTDYSDAFARKLVYPLTVDAFNKAVQDCINATLNDYEFGGQFLVHCDVKKDSCSAFVVADHTSKYIVISFRGSIDGQEVIEEINETILHPMVPFVGGGNVNYFFNNGFTLLWNAGLKDSFLTLKNKYPDYQILVTGHSLGAAEATICAGTISALKYVEPSKILLMAFGSPRVGDKAFADAFPKLVREAYRVVHRKDLIPHLPPEGLLGYIHIASEVWYDNDMNCGDPYVICNVEESNNCSSQVLDPVFRDHGEYYRIQNYLGGHQCITPADPCS